MGPRLPMSGSERLRKLEDSSISGAQGEYNRKANRVGANHVCNGVHVALMGVLKG